MNSSECFAKVVTSRRSVRGYLPQPIARQELEDILTLAQRAPSNCNTQPWLTAAVMGQTCDALRSKIIEAVRNGELSLDYPYDQNYHDVYRERQIDAAVQLFKAQGISREDKEGRRSSFERNYAFFDAPHVLFLFLPDWASVREAADLGMYAQTLMLALTAHGIACCPQTSLSYFADLVREELEIDPSWKLLFGISFGYENAAEPANQCRVGRAPLEDTVRFYE